jgi:hypothetical protein
VRRYAAKYRRKAGCLAVLVLLAAVLAAALIGIDNRISRAPHPGFTGPCEWRLYAPDLPRFAKAFMALPPAAAAEREMPDFFSTLSKDFEQRAGFRFSPARWRYGLGPQLVAGGNESGVIGCFYPGLLARTVHALRVKVLQREPVQDAIYRYGEHYYAWRGRFLLVSPSLKMVQTALDAPPVKLPPQQFTGRHEIRISLPNRLPIETVTLSAAPGMPVRMIMKTLVTRRRTPLELAGAAPDDPLISLTASRWQDIRACLDTAAELLPEEMKALFPASLPALAGHLAGAEKLPLDWDAGITETALALTGLDTSAFLPVPEIAVMMRQTADRPGGHPLDALFSGRPVFPYEWNGCPGRLSPVLGEKVSLCLAQDGAVALAASREPVMAGLAGRLKKTAPVRADLVLTWAWPELARQTEILLRRAAAAELIPGMNCRDAESRILPWLRVMAAMGRARFTGVCDGGGLVLDGVLINACTEEIP